MQGVLSPEVEKAFLDLGLDKLDIEIERLLKREWEIIQQNDYFSGDKNLTLVRDLFIAGLAWRLLDSSTSENNLGAASNNKMAAFLYLARYLTKNQKWEFERARATSQTYLATSGEAGTIGEFVVNRTHDAPAIQSGFLADLVKRVHDGGNFPIQPKKAGRLIVGLERLARFVGWAFAGVGFLLGMVMFNSNGDGVGAAIVTGAVTGGAMYGLTRGVGWVLKGFILESP